MSFHDKPSQSDFLHRGCSPGALGFQVHSSWIQFDLGSSVSYGSNQKNYLSIYLQIGLPLLLGNVVAQRKLRKTRSQENKNETDNCDVIVAQMVNLNRVAVRTFEKTKNNHRHHDINARRALYRLCSNVALLNGVCQDYIFTIHIMQSEFMVWNIHVPRPLKKHSPQFFHPCKSTIICFQHCEYKFSISNAIKQTDLICLLDQILTNPMSRRHPVNTSSNLVSFCVNGKGWRKTLFLNFCTVFFTAMKMVKLRKAH